MSFWAVGIAAVSVASSVMSSNAQAKQRNEQILAERQSAKYNYLATESSINIMKATSRESTKNAIGEVLRVGSENARNIEGAIQKEQSKVLATSEGLASGRSKGRQMITGYIKGNKLLAQAKDQSTSSIIKLSTEQDEYTNQLNNKLIGAHQEMAAILAGRGPSIDGTSAAISAGISGASVGASFGASIK